VSVVFTNPAVLRPNEVLGTGQVRRQIARAHLQWVRDYQGPDALSRLLSELPFEVVEEIAAAPSVAWSSFRSVVLLDRAIESMFGRGKRGFLRELGRYSAHLNLSPFRTYRPEDLHRFFARMPLLHRQFQDFGVVSWVPTSESSGSLSHREYSSYSAVYCESALGYYEQIIVAHGAAPQLVIESSCQCAGAGSCTFELAWD
jgi:hypothetical protein